MRVLVVTNPRATATTVRERDVLAHAVGSVAELEVAETANRGHAAALACRAMRNGTDVVVAMGGDGTVNEVINGLLTDGVHDRVPALGLVPTGSTNVFVRALGPAQRPDRGHRFAARGVAVRHHAAGQPRAWPTTAGSASPPASASTPRSCTASSARRRQGKRSTHALYTRVGVREFFRAERRRPQLHVELPDGTRLDDVYFTIVANADPWTYVGDRPLHPTPTSSFDTGLASTPAAG